MPKSLCKIKKLLKTDLDLYVEHVREPRYVCRSCGRVANKKKLLCEPVKLEALDTAAYSAAGRKPK